MTTQAAHIDQAISQEITLARLYTMFAALALVISCVGLHGTVAFSVARRTKEIGIRVALGATAPGVLWLVLREVLALSILGYLLEYLSRSPVPASSSHSCMESSPTTRHPSPRSIVILLSAGLLAASCRPAAPPASTR